MTTAREMLDAIDEFLTTAPLHEAEDLWNVLTALRGPDSENDTVKFETTSRIRTAAFPKSAHGQLSHHMATFTHGLVDANRDRLREQRHFSHHVDMAASALGILDNPSGR